MKHTNYCTLFDKNFLTRGMGLYESLEKHVGEFTLWMLCMDDIAYETLMKINLPRAKLLRVSEVEDVAMLAVKPTRTTSEYCWMFSSALPLYILENNPGLYSITYLDADMYFFKSPEPVFQELSEKSVLIIPHYYSPKQKHREETSGIYNVGMMTFRNNEDGLEVLRWWKERCIEWCFARYEDGKFGDQLYLNDWPTRFNGVHILEHRGVDVASWNIYNYHIVKKDGELYVKERHSGKLWPLILYHYHGMKIYSPRKGVVKAHPVTVLDIHIYEAYVSAIERALKKIQQLEPDWNYGFTPKLDIIRVIKQKIQRLFHE